MSQATSRRSDEVLDPLEQIFKTAKNWWFWCLLKLWVAINCYISKTRCKHAPPRGALVQYLFWKKVWYVFLFQWYFQIRCMYINVWSYGNSCFQYNWSPPVLGCEGASRTKVYSCLEKLHVSTNFVRDTTTFLVTQDHRICWTTKAWLTTNS